MDSITANKNIEMKKIRNVTNSMAEARRLLKQLQLSNATFITWTGNTVNTDLGQQQETDERKSNAELKQSLA